MTRLFSYYQFDIHTAVLILTLCLLCITCNGKANAATTDQSLITGVNPTVLQSFHTVIGIKSVDAYGTVYTFPNRQGLSGVFRVGVFMSHAEAEQIFNSITRSTGAITSTIDGVGIRACGWQAHEDEERYSFAFQRANAIVEFEWNGLLLEAKEFAKKLDDALQNDIKLAPHADAISLPVLEIAIPRLVAARESFNLMYRTRPNTLLTLAPQLEDRCNGQIPPVMVTLSGETQTAPALRRNCTLDAVGEHQLTLTFVTENSVVIRRTSAIRVLSPDEMKLFATCLPWELPEQAIYLTDKARTAWQQTPEVDREKISLVRNTFSKLPPQPEAEEDFVRIQAWNMLANTMRTEWLPLQTSLQIYENAAKPSRDRIAYAAYQHNDYRILFMAESGKQAWIYLEKDDLNGANKTTVTAQELLLSTEPSNEGDNQQPPTILINTLNRYRAFTPTMKPEPVTIILIHIRMPGQATLKFPTYP